MQCPGTKDQFAPRLERLDCASLQEFHAAGTFAGEQDAPRPRLRDHLQVGATGQMRGQIGARRIPAFAILLRNLMDADAFLVVAVEIGNHRESGLPGGLKVYFLERIHRPQIGNIERPALSVMLVPEILVVFRFLEIGQHLPPGPAVIAQRCPMVVVPGMAARIHHRVDRT